MGKIIKTEWNMSKYMNTACLLKIKLKIIKDIIPWDPSVKVVNYFFIGSHEGGVVRGREN